MTRRMFNAQAILLGLALIVTAPLVNAIQLINIHSDNCHYCVKFQKEVGTDGFNAVSLNVPMVTIDIEEPVPAWWKEAQDDGRISPIKYTPTFILLDDNNQEVGRFVGYRNPEWFFEKFNSLFNAYWSSLP
jgi:thioredoxin-related protein